MKQVTDRATVSRWLTGYEAAWRARGTGGLADLFTGDATYLKSPYEQPLTDLDAIKRMWEEEREGPDEVFTLRQAGNRMLDKEQNNAKHTRRSQRKSTRRAFAISR